MNTSKVGKRVRLEIKKLFGVDGLWYFDGVLKYDKGHCVIIDKVTTKQCYGMTDRSSELLGHVISVSPTNVLPLAILDDDANEEEII